MAKNEGMGAVEKMKKKKLTLTNLWRYLLGSL